jgi:hypothetical protein
MSLTSKGGKKTEVFYFYFHTTSSYLRFLFLFFLDQPWRPAGLSPGRQKGSKSDRRTAVRPRPPARRAGRQVLELPSSVSFLSLSLLFLFRRRPFWFFFVLVLGIFGFWWVCFCGNTVLEYWVCSDRSIFPTFADFFSF